MANVLTVRQAFTASVATPAVIGIDTRDSKRFCATVHNAGASFCTVVTRVGGFGATGLLAEDPWLGMGVNPGDTNPLVETLAGSCAPGYVQFTITPTSGTITGTLEFSGAK